MRPSNCVISAAVAETDNAKLLQQLKSGFKKRVNWSKYQ